MPRRARPWFRSSRGMWYTTIRGEQTPLHVTDPSDEAGAWAAFQALLQQAKTGPPVTNRTVADIVSAYLADVEPRVKPRTLKGYRWYLSQWLARNGTLPVATLTAEQIEKEAKRLKWANTTRNNYLCTIETCLRWAGVKLRLLKPAKESAGAESVIPDEVYRRMLQHCAGDWYAVIQFLWHTGCRPSEASAITAEAVDIAGKVVRLKDHKTVRTTKGDRIIYLNDAALEIVQWQIERHGSGHLFRGVAGRPFSPQAFVMKFQRLSRRVGRRVNAYGIRHTFATRALAAQESDTIVAALLGHKSTQMIHRHYSHLSAMGRQLSEAAERLGKSA